MSSKVFLFVNSKYNIKPTYIYSVNIRCRQANQKQRNVDCGRMATQKIYWYNYYLLNFLFC